jgi:hypothetical protein
MAPHHYGNIVKVINDFHKTFPSQHLSLASVPSDKTVTKLKAGKISDSRLVSTDFNYIVPKRKGLGKIYGKKKQIGVKTPDLISQIRTKYAFLLKEEGDGYIIDLTDLNKIKRRKRYLPIGCTIHVDKDLTTATVSDVDGSVSPDTWEQVAQTALSVFTVIYNIVVLICNAILNPSSIATKSLPDGTTKKNLFPFHIGSSQFLEKVDKFLIGEGNLLYHITGFETESLNEYLRNSAKSFNHKLPVAASMPDIEEDQPLPKGLAGLPLIIIGQKYWAAIRAWVVDSIENKAALDTKELKGFIAQVGLPEEWTQTEAVTYILWNITFTFGVSKQAVDDLKQFGTYLTDAGHFLHEGVVDVIDALAALLAFTSTKLTSASELTTSPALSRKMISVSQYITNKYPEYSYLKPSNVSMTIV